MEIKDYKNLCSQITDHMDRYYNKDEPTISDYEFDKLMIQLKKVEKEHPEWVSADSPTQKVGGVPTSNAKVKHNIPMLSIADVFTLDDVSDWVKKVKDLHPDAKFSVEPKIDGLSMSIRMKRDSETSKISMYLAESRGTGLEGDDVTTNAKMISDVKQSLDLPYEYLEIRGEVYMTHEVFNQYNKTLEEEGKKLAANPRNLAAGTLRVLHPEILKERPLSMFIFNIQDGPKELMKSHCEGLDILTAAGVKCVEHKLCNTEEEILNAIKEIGESREGREYDIDGAVVKIDQIEYRSDFPSSAKYSAGHIAYKYPPEEKTIIMDNIIVDVGRTGKLTFTGSFSPVKLCGTMVSKVTLHNQDYINEMKIGVGGSYKLFKSGEIIPKLNGCVTSPHTVFKAPTTCPVCGKSLNREEDTADIRCVNPFCPAQLSRTIAYFASVNCMKIDGLGDKLVDALISEGFLKNYADLYTLKNHRTELVEKAIIGKEKNTDKILSAIEKSKKNDPVRLLTALGIRNVGLSTARELIRTFKSIRKISEASLEELVSLNDIGETTAQSIFDFFRNQTNIEMIKLMETNGVNMTVSETSKGSDKLKGKSIVVTGTLPSLGRKEIQELIINNGGKSVSSVSKKTDYVVAGDEAGSKLAKANELGVKVISEEEFLKMIK